MDQRRAYPPFTGAEAVQSNWIVGGASPISWTGAADHSWAGLNWSGTNITGGTVTAVSNGLGGGTLEVSGLGLGSTGPAAGSNISIQSSTGATVTGPTAAASVWA